PPAAPQADPLSLHDALPISGREHTVITGICLRHRDGAIVDHSTTTVRFALLTGSEIDEYVGSGEPMDKAGAYAIQGLANGSSGIDRKSTRLNSSHVSISYAV